MVTHPGAQFRGAPAALPRLPLQGRVMGNPRDSAPVRGCISGLPRPFSGTIRTHSMRAPANTNTVRAAPGQRQRGAWQGVLLGAIAGMFAAAVGLYLLVEAMINSEDTLAVRADPAAQTHLGTVRECTLQFWASGADPRPDHLHYACTGTQGDAIVEVHTESTGPNASEEIVSGELVLANGERVPLQGKQTGQPP